MATNREFYLFISSDNRTYGTPSNFNVATSEANVRPGVSVAISLESFDMYNLQYPVNSTNNTIVFRENGNDVTDLTATIAPGNYTASEFVAVLKAALEAVGANTYTVAFNNNTSKITVSLTLPDTFKFVSLSPTLTGYEPMTSFVAVAEADYPVNLAGVEHIDVCFPGLLHANMTTSPTNTNGLLARVPLDQAFGDLIVWRSQESDDSVIVEHDRLLNLNVRIRNPDGTDYQQPNNAPISIVLRCSMTGDV